MIYSYTSSEHAKDHSQYLMVCCMYISEVPMDLEWWV